MMFGGKNTFNFFAIALVALVLIGAGCGGPSTAEIEVNSPVKLTIWRTFDDSNTMREIINAYRVIHPNVSFDYQKRRFDDYENELLRAFARGEGPDIFSIHNTWVGEYKDLISPLPPSLSIPYSETKGTIKKEVVVTVRTEPTLSLRQIKTDFVDVVAEDVVRLYQPNPKKPGEERIYAIPLALDSLSLYFNKDLLNAAGIAEAPKNWTDFQEAIKLLTRLDTQGNIIQSGAAIGTSENVERATDILSVLMMQNGTQMTTERGSPTFGDKFGDVFPGIQATRFYSDFANPVKEVYTWNELQPDSFDAFVSGKTAMFFGYSYHLALIRAQAPKLNFGVSILPQISEGRVVNYANYWAETVSKSSENQKWAWDFIQFATDAEQVASYLAAAKKPTALRSLINSQIEDEELSPFVRQVLTAKSWYKGKDANIAEQAFLDLIDNILAGADEEEAIQQAESKVSQSL